MYVAIDPKTGLQIRKATETEIAVYVDANKSRKHFEKPVMVGTVLIDCYTGHGLWFGGAGF